VREQGCRWENFLRFRERRSGKWIWWFGNFNDLQWFFVYQQLKSFFTRAKREAQGDISLFGSET